MLIFQFLVRKQIVKSCAFEIGPKKNKKEGGAGAERDQIQCARGCGLSRVHKTNQRYCAALCTVGLCVLIFVRLPSAVFHTGTPGRTTVPLRSSSRSNNMPIGRNFWGDGRRCKKSITKVATPECLLHPYIMLSRLPPEPPIRHFGVVLGKCCCINSTHTHTLIYCIGYE